MTIDDPAAPTGTPDPDAAAAPPREPVVTARRILISFLLAGAVVGFFYAFTSSVDESQPEPPTAVKLVFPVPNDLQLRQDAIGYELADGYAGALRIDDTEIPDDQLDIISGINRISYAPAPDKETGELEPGRHCAVARYWPDDEPEDDETFRWCFNVH